MAKTYFKPFKSKSYKKSCQFPAVNACVTTIKKMPKRKSNVEINNPSKKITLESITGTDGSLENIKKYEKACQASFVDETPEYFFLLENIADDLEINEDISENYNSDETDGFIQIVKELAEKLFNEIKEGFADTPIENQSKKTKFTNALIRIFSILLNANLRSAKKINKVIKQSVKLILTIWQRDGLNILTNTAEPKALVETEELQTEQTQTQEL